MKIPRIPTRAAMLGASTLAFIAAGPFAASGASATGAADSTPAPGGGASSSRIAPPGTDPDALPTPFYAAPEALPAQPGVVVKKEPSEFYLGGAKVVKLGKSSHRIMYTTTNSQGRTVPVTGTFLESGARWTGKGARPLISFAAGTQGVANVCAPSYQGSQGTEYESSMISQMLNAGYNVVMTDYIGLGTKGMHTYMDRLDQGHAVLDAARAAREAGLGGTSAATPVGLAGYSQGGGASASAAELAPTYAPDINLKAAYAGAVPADLTQVIRQIDGSLYNAFLMYSVQGLLESAGVDPAQFLSPTGLKAYSATNALCTTQAIGTTASQKTSSYTKTGETLTQLSVKPPFTDRLAAQKLGVGRAPKVPVLISHSVLDDVIPYKTGRDLASRWCAQGTRVTMDTTMGPTHIGGNLAAVPRAMIYFDRQFHGLESINSCGSL